MHLGNIHFLVTSSYIEAGLCISGVLLAVRLTGLNQPFFFLRGVSVPCVDCAPKMANTAI